MFTALPAESVFEAKRRTRRATAVLLALLSLGYIIFTNILVVGGIVALPLLAKNPELVIPEPIWFVWISGSALLAALIHFHFARKRSLDDLLARFAARPADRSDALHARFIRLVGEAELATGIRPIRAVVIPDPGRNAFSIQDGDGNCAIGVTEGTLGLLKVHELGAVVAHEAAHLVHEDSALATCSCSLFAVFDSIQTVLENSLSHKGTGRGRSGHNAVVFLGLLWVLTSLGKLFTNLVGMAVSRQREFLADAGAVGLCKNPLALAGALQKLSKGYRGTPIPGYNALFLINPVLNKRDEDEGLLAELFSNHPPIRKRMALLLNWAKKHPPKPKTELAVPKAEARASAKPRYMVHQENSWKGPYDILQLQALGTLSPDTWICPQGGDNVQSAGEMPVLVPLFRAMLGAKKDAMPCPRCKTPLIKKHYEGAVVHSCPFCKGHFLKEGVLVRLMARESEVFPAHIISKVKAWRDRQQGQLKDRPGPKGEVKCPSCGEVMGAFIHSALTQVVLNRCPGETCRAVWCDKGELEAIQILVEDARNAVE